MDSTIYEQAVHKSLGLACRNVGTESSDLDFELDRCRDGDIFSRRAISSSIDLWMQFDLLEFGQPRGTPILETEVHGSQDQGHFQKLAKA